MKFSIECGLGDEVCLYLKKIKVLSNCNDSCSCSSDTPSRVIGLGYLVGPAGPAGAQGIQGASGNNGNYVTVTAEPAGLNCATGGQKVVLYDGSTNLSISTSYICNGAVGATGTPGINGTNAFKFIKEVDSGDGATIVIPYATRTQCSTPDGGCVDGGGDPNFFVDYHMQIQFRADNTSNWTLFGPSDVSSIITNYTNGTITITTGAPVGIYRVVILA
jgi:hypothetical protein